MAILTALERAERALGRKVVVTIVQSKEGDNGSSVEPPQVFKDALRIQMQQKKDKWRAKYP